ncbi:acyltransferase family protein [Vibrio parahaemolyticus]
MVRNNAFDAAKGLLIILVILGHVLLGSISENVGREAIYFFHMPIFLAISGFYISDHILSCSIADVFKKYKNKLIIPFCVAFIFYTSLKIIINGELDFKTIVFSFLYPFYHLWYVPAVLIFIFYIRIINAIKIRCSILFYFICFVFFASTIYFEGYGQDAFQGTVYHLLGDKRFYYFFSYFYLGYLLSKFKFKMSFDFIIASLLLSFVVYTYSDAPLILGLAKFTANISLILIFITLFGFGANYFSSFFSKVGMVSLPIYLWHVLPILFLKKISLNDSEYYSFSLVVISIFLIIVVNFKGRFKFLDKYFYGC